MKIKKLLLLLLFLTIMVLFDLSLMLHCRNVSRLNGLLCEDTIEIFRAQEVPLTLLEQFRDWEKEEKDSYSCYEYLCVYLMTKESEQSSLRRYIRQLLIHHPEEFTVYTGYLKAVWEDLTWFPVPFSAVNPETDVAFGNSWMNLRTFGGDRGHEGSDIMALLNERGRYPVLSMTDGVVEQAGWLTQGGYRLGIRAPHGGYFYYAHLYDYVRDYKPGDIVKAGELIGFMGDSGYGEAEGTVGNFDVHLHVGIYVNRPDGTEMSINSFWPLKFLEEHRLKYSFY